MNWNIALGHHRFVLFYFSIFTPVEYESFAFCSFCNVRRGMDSYLREHLWIQSLGGSGQGIIESIKCLYHKLFQRNEVIWCP